MAIIKKLVKGVSATVGEILVVGGALGTAYVLGFVKGSDLKDKIHNAIDGVASAVNTTATKAEEEPVAEAEATESTTGDDTPPIEVSVTNQPED